MKPSHLQTPRTLAECTFTTGYSSVQEPAWETVAGYILAIAIGTGLAVMLVWGLTK